jgi:hypothetical protein
MPQDNNEHDGGCLGCLLALVFMVGLVAFAGWLCAIAMRAAAWGWSLAW